MVESDDNYNWKKVFKKFLHKQEDNVSEEKMKESSWIASNVTEEKRVTGTLVLISSDSCKFPSFDKLPSKRSPAHAELRTRKERNNSVYDRSVPVPEWNKVFKEILGPKLSVGDNGDQKNLQYSVKEPEYLQKLDVPVNINSRPSKKVPEIEKIEESPDEKKAREIISRAREFKKINYHINLNDFEGAGVNIFAHDKEFFVPPYIKSVESTGIKGREINKVDPRVNLNDFEGAGIDIFKRKRSSFVPPLKKPAKSSRVKPGKRYIPDYPLTGFVAKYEEYTTTDLASPSIPFDEKPWDDELLI